MMSRHWLIRVRLLLISGVVAAMIPVALVSPRPVYAQSEAPTVIVPKGDSTGVTSFDVPSPGLVYHTAAVCPEGGGPKAAAASAEVSPDATNSASPMLIWRTTVRAEEPRLVQGIWDGSGANACNPYKVYSNVVADANFAYWVDATGLVKLPLTANYWDTPTLMNAAYGFERPVELLDDGDRLLAVSNLPVQNGPFGTTGGSYVEAVSKATGEYDVLYRPGGALSPEDKGFRNIQTDGNYIYFVDEDRVLLRLDARGETRVVIAAAADVSSYYPEGEVTFCPTIQCFTTDYIFYAQGNVIRRRDHHRGYRYAGAYL